EVLESAAGRVSRLHRIWRTTEPGWKAIRRYLLAQHLKVASSMPDAIRVTSCRADNDSAWRALEPEFRQAILAPLLENGIICQPKIEHARFVVRCDDHVVHVCRLSVVALWPDGFKAIPALGVAAHCAMETGVQVIVGPGACVPAIGVGVEYIDRKSGEGCLTFQYLTSHDKTFAGLIACGNDNSGRCVARCHIFIGHIFRRDQVRC